MTLVAEWSDHPKFIDTMRELIYSDPRMFHVATFMQIAATCSSEERDQVIGDLIAGGYLERYELASLCDTCGLKKEPCRSVESVTAGRALGALLLRYTCGYTQCASGNSQPYPTPEQENP